MWKHLHDPVYVYRPWQILRRLKYLLNVPSGEEEANLPWGGRLSVLASELQGKTILHRGITQLVVTEACFRLARPGTVAVDAGANVGQMTSALAHAMGEGKIHAFEPHPVIFSLLDQNKKKIVDEVRSARIEASQIALSEKNGCATLHVPTRWEQNAGIASLEDSAGSDEIEVPTRRLDEVVNSPIHLLKLDVEGHEKAVLDGAIGHLEGGGCSHIIFEDHEGRTSAVAKKLKSQGYKIFGIEERLSGPVLRENGPEGAYNFIATANLDQCISEFGPDGWKSLQAQ